MTDTARDKYVRVMEEINALEIRVAELTQAVSASAEPADPGAEARVRQQLGDARQRLAERMVELARITDACRTIHVKR